MASAAMPPILKGTPYVQLGASGELGEIVGRLQRRADDLRSTGRLTEATLKAYFGDKRFEEIAESNAIEGSPLDAGETRLAVLQGVTISGHDPSWSRDAVNLSHGLDFVVELAKDRAGPPMHLARLRELHTLILAGSRWAGQYRTVNVEISGSPHHPPRFAEIPAAMEEWSEWSETNREAPPILRAIVLSVWLTHIHPFRDGNGRTSRAVMNLELIRGGLPSVIIRKKDRHRYYEALAESDTGGDLRPIAELIAARAGHAMDHLERAARAHQGYERDQVRLLRDLERRVGIWNQAVNLLLALVHDELQARVGALGTVTLRWYGAGLDTDDYQALFSGDSSGNSWLARVGVEIPGLGAREFLAWVGYRSPETAKWRDLGPGPAIRWSVPNPDGYPRWLAAEAASPGFEELTLRIPDVDLWIARTGSGEIHRTRPSQVAGRIASDIFESVRG